MQGAKTGTHLQRFTQIPTRLRSGCTCSLKHGEAQNATYTACLVGRANADAEEDLADNEAGDGGGKGLEERSGNEAKASQRHCGLAAVGVAEDTGAEGGDGAAEEHARLPQLHQEKAHRAASEEKWADTDLKVRVVGITTSTQSCIRGEAGPHTLENKADGHHNQQISRLGHFLPAADRCQTCSRCCQRPPGRGRSA